MGKVLGDVFTFMFFILVSRTYGQEGIGEYSFAIAFTGFFAMLADFGLHGFSIKQLSRNLETPGATYGRFFSLRLILSVIFFGLLLLSLPFLSFPVRTKIIIALIGAYQIICKLFDGHIAIFISVEETHFAGLLEACFRFLNASTGILIIMAGGDLITTIGGLTFVTFIQFIVLYGIIARKHGQPKIVGSISSLIGLLREAIPYALSSLLYQLYSRIDVVLLGFILGSVAAGVYNVAYRVVFLLLFVPHFAAVAVFPQASRMFLHSREELNTLCAKSLNMAILIGLPSAAGLWLIAPYLIVLLFGPEFRESILILRYLAWLLFFAFLSRITVTFLVSCDRQTQVTQSQFLAAMVNVAGNLLLIPSIGIKGAAISTLASEFLLIILLLVRLRTELGWPRIGSRLAISSLATGCFCLPFSFLTSLSLFTIIPASIFIYVVTLLFFKEIRNNETRAIISLFKNKHVKTESTGEELF